MVKEEEFSFGGWLSEGMKGVKSRRKAFVPKEFRGHMRAAAREVLLSWRSLLDTAIEHLGEKPAKKKTRIKVE